MNSSSMLIPDPLKDQIKKLSESFELLNNTTKQVSEEATATAAFLRDKLSDTTFRFFSVIDAINDLVIVKDANGRWKTVNKFGQNLYKMSRSDYYGKTDLEIAEDFPEYMESLYYCTHTDKKAWESRKYTREVETITINNETHYFDVIKTPVYHENGLPKELIVIGRDITELRKKDQYSKAFNAALNAASDIILILDNNEKITFCNDAFLSIFGYDSLDEVVTSHISMIESDVSQELHNDIWSTIRSNRVWQGFISVKHQDDHPIYSYTTILPVMNSHVEPIFYICTLKIKSNTETL